MPAPSAEVVVDLVKVMIDIMQIAEPTLVKNTNAFATVTEAEFVLLQRKTTTGVDPWAAAASCKRYWGSH